MGEHPIKLERAIKLISVPELTNISLGLYELDTYVNQTVTLLSIYGDNSINCTLTDTLSIVDVSYLFASQIHQY